MTLSEYHSENRLSTLQNMGLEYFRKSCANIKIFKNLGNLKQKLRENIFYFSQGICVSQVVLCFGAVARIAGLGITPAASVA